MRVKPLFYAKIDYARMPNLFSKYKQYFNLKPIIHVIGTNGKGSTGRWLALMLKQAGFRVGHYTSPHVQEYNERFWIDGLHVNYDTLDKHHERLLNIIDKDDANSLSYFEYSTFLASLVFEDCDFVILEAGLGGEYDATNVFQKRLSVVTTIGHDHEDFLGYTLKAITTTKLNSITTTTIMSPQNDEIITKTAQKIADKKSIKLKIISNNINPTFEKSIELYLEKYNYPDFFKANLLTAYESAKELGVEVDFDSLKPLDLVGRCEKIAPNITIDVGHNPLSAKAIAKHFKKKSVILVYNSYQDKDMFAILTHLEPITLHVKILALEQSDRKLGEKNIIKILDELNLSWDYFDGKIDKDRDYLVFGSFYVVENFLKSLDER